MNNCSFTGRLTKDPETTAFDSGKTRTSFTLAVDRKFKKDTADFINFVAWGKIGETVSTYLTKGMMVGVTGDLQQRSYEDKQGVKRTVYEVNVSDLSFLEHKKKEESPTPPKIDEETDYYQPSLDSDDEAMLPFDI